MDPSIPNSNSSKNLDADGRPIYPSVYEFEEVTMINRFGVTANISHLITSFSIIEELFSSLLTAKIRIRDNENFFENFRLNGQEIVNVKIKYLKDANSRNVDEILEHQFVVKDYPLFTKTGEGINVQEYEITLVSAHAYLSRLQQISLSVRGNPLDSIREIFQIYLGNPKLIFPARTDQGPPRPAASGDPWQQCVTNNFKGVITLRTPLQAVEWLKSNCYDQESSPFFVYTTLQDNSIIARSWSEIIGTSNIPYYPLGERIPYSIKPFGNAKPDTPEYLKELKTKILNLSSNIKLDKLTQAITGGIGTVTEIIDFKSRSYQEETVSPGGESAKNKLGQDYTSVSANIFSRVVAEFKGETASAIVNGIPNSGTRKYYTDEEFNFSYLNQLKINGQRPKIVNSILDDPRANQQIYYLAAEPYGPDYQGSSKVKLDFLKESKLYKANMEAVTHNISTYGDPNLKAGTKIDVFIPKAVDTTTQEPGKDKSLSGLYIIAVSVHTFQGGVYTNQLKIIRDGDL